MTSARRLRTYASAIFFILFALPAASATLSVAVAANMQYVFADIKTEFKKETGHELSASYSSSGKFATQIVNGAPFDVFLSADMEYPEYLYAKGFASAAPKVYAYGSLVLWSMKDLDLRQWQTLLADDRVKKIALPNPKTAPYGREAMRVLTFYKLGDKVSDKLVFGESISQTNQYIHSGAVELGFTAKSIVTSSEMTGQGKWIDLHGDMHQGARNRTLDALRRGQVRVLVATDVAARGIDVPAITHVFNYDLPKFPEDYVHRIGRTGRAGRNGVAVSLVNHAEGINVKRIERFTKQLIPVDVIEGFEPKKSAVASRSTARKPGGWKPGDARTNTGGNGYSNNNSNGNSSKPGQRTFSKPNSPSSSGPRGEANGNSSGYKGSGSRFGDANGNRRSFGDR